jgi:hypothetical protein
MSDTINLNNPARAAIAEFSPVRLGWLIRNRILQDLIPLGIGAAIILGINLLTLLPPPHRVWFNNFSHGGFLWTIAVMAVSYILASTAFRDMQSGKSGTDWLLLPATTLEKYLAALLELVIIIPLLALCLATGLSALLAGIQGLAGGTGGAIWTPLDWEYPAVWGTFAVSTLLFLTGSAVFRKQALLKTLGVLTAFALVLSALLSGLAWLLLRITQFGSSDIMINGEFFGTMNVNGKNAPAWMGTAIAWIWGTLWFGVTPIASVVFGYFRVREKEAKDAVQ